MKKACICFGGVLLIFCVSGLLFLRMADGSVDSKTMLVQDKVLAISRDVLHGDFLEAKDFTWVDWQGFSQDQALYFLKGKADPKDLEGVILRAPLERGENLRRDTVVWPGEAAFLTAVLRKGMRAFTIQVDTVTGGAGLIRPGNRVDVILSGKFGAGVAGIRGFASAQTLLTDIEVIAVDKDFEQVGIRAKNKDESVANSRKKGTVTLEVNPKEVELLTVASSAGTLSLSLRNLFEYDRGDRPTGNITTAAEIMSRIETDAASSKPVVTLYGGGNRQQ